MAYLYSESVEHAVNAESIDQSVHIKECLGKIQSMEKLVEQMSKNPAEPAESLNENDLQDQLKEMLRQTKNTLKTYLNGVENEVNSKNVEVVEDVEQILPEKEDERNANAHIWTKSAGDQLGDFRNVFTFKKDQNPMKCCSQIHRDTIDEWKTKGSEEEKWRKVLEELKMSDHRDAKVKGESGYEKQLEDLAKIIVKSHDERNFYSDDSNDDDECSFYVLDEEKSTEEKAPKKRNVSNSSVVQSSVENDLKTMKMVSNAEKGNSESQSIYSSLLLTSQHENISNATAVGGDATNKCNCSSGICASLGDSTRHDVSQGCGIASSHIIDPFAINAQEFDSLKFQTTTADSIEKEDSIACSKKDETMFNETSKTCSTAGEIISETASAFSIQTRHSLQSAGAVKFN